MRAPTPMIDQDPPTFKLWPPLDIRLVMEKVGDVSTFEPLDQHACMPVRSNADIARYESATSTTIGRHTADSTERTMWDVRIPLRTSTDLDPISSPELPVQVSSPLS